MKNSSTYQLLIAIAVLVIIAGYLYLNPFRGESVPEPYGSEINTEQKITPVQTPQTSTASGEKSDLKAESKAESKAEIDTTTKPEDESTAKPEDKSPQGESSVNTNSEDNTASEESVPEEIADNPLGLGEELTPEKEALLDAQIKKVQEFNEEDWKEPELTEAQKKELQEKQAQADNSRVDKDNFLKIASETQRKTLAQQAEEDGAIGVKGDYPDGVLDPKSPQYDWKLAIKAKPIPLELGKPLVDNPEDLVQLHPKQNIWYDKKNNVTVMHGAVGLNRGPLELFACTGRVSQDRSFPDRVISSGPKAHESVLVFDIFPHLMHASLLACGVEPGKPAVFSPNFIPPTGAGIEVILRWKDKDGKIQQAHAGDWILDEKTNQTMNTPFVFTGSMFMVNARDGKRMYLGDVDGELICVSNFPSAVMDVPIESSESNDARLFIANEAVIPPCGTPVTMILKPMDKKY